jgi:hypothetical protein
MSETLAFDKLVEAFHHELERLPDPRQGKNITYEMKDAALGAFSVFFTQSPSFLAHQRHMQQSKGHSNAGSLFRIERIPTDPQIRNLLDPLPPERVYGTFGQVVEALDQADELASFRTDQELLLVALDGTQYFSSQKIHCQNCSHRTTAQGQTIYSHSVITPVIVNPEQAHVLPLEPEFIRPQDGHDKQDCERAAAKRWLRQHGARYAAYHVTVLGDDLYCNQPLCELLLEQELSFILVCKPDSHPKLYEWLDFLSAGPEEDLPSHSIRYWNGRFGEIWTCRYVNDVPLRAGEDALLVSWCELTIHHEQSGEQLYYNTFVTNYRLTESTVEPIARAGRGRWKIENEHNNVLKNRGYHLEHNFGHGHNYLSMVLLTLNLLAFLFHTVLALGDDKYQCLRQALAVRQTFFNDLRTLTRYLYFDSWDHLLTFMIDHLELGVPPD